MPNLIHDEARQLWSRSMGRDDRVLVTGASGWFGRTTCALLDGLQLPVLLTASTAKVIKVAGSTFHCEPWDWATIVDFRPTVVVDCAFLTRDRVADMDLAGYVAANEALTRNMLDASGLPSVARVVTISSGAAVHPADALEGTLEDNPYGYLKRRAEEDLAALALKRGISATVARAWSVSGAFVQKPRSYALSDMLTQAKDGAIHILAGRLVYRRYCSVEDLLAVALASARGGATEVVDSGGLLVEMGDLAEVVARTVGTDARISREPMTDDPPDDYHSNNAGWTGACSAAGFTPAALDAQVATAYAGLLQA